MTRMVEAQSLTKRFGEVSAVADLMLLQAGMITGSVSGRSRGLV